ncbi:Cof-type HAD-IIB family hydrolase [Bacillus thermotolerans]|uniref:Hydrolase n=1 Tax=Bacillus thermotolerans TaxID=1221996 RepID=A0A0C2BWC3_BACTR|nr:Cof-type HAD-IIB family hydrolase [Bacillus thermotolerans]KKB39191.1 Hydrolase [Bacillus thermotolerans]KKB41947.1 Hydrolase [Bacillus thermotolerans]KKB42632.1 Hydrolase [Bacillus thermotolerans]
MTKIAFFDIDGTLLNHDKKLPSATKEAVKRLRDNGVYTAIATGRAPFMFEDLREELDIHSFVSFNGQYVVFEEEVVYLNPLAADSLDRLYRHAEERNHSLVYMTESHMKANRPDDTYIAESISSLKFPYPDLHPDLYKEQELYQTLVFCKEEEEEYYREQFPEFSFIRWHPYSLDILPRGGSKAEGIKKLMDRLDFKMEDVYAFGDGLNDIEMLKVAGTGVAMGNAHPKVKEAADLVTADVAEDGIYHALKKLELI